MLMNFKGLLDIGTKAGEKWRYFSSPLEQAPFPTRGQAMAFLKQEGRMNEGVSWGGSSV